MLMGMLSLKFKKIRTYMETTISQNRNIALSGSSGIRPLHMHGSCRFTCYLAFSLVNMLVELEPRTYLPIICTNIDLFSSPKIFSLDYNIKRWRKSSDYPYQYLMEIEFIYRLSIVYFKQFFKSKAVNCMIINKTNRLHHCVANCRSNKTKSSGLKIFA